MKIDPTKEPHENCPSFEKCNTNKCPLHRDFIRLENKPEDKKLLGGKKCRASKKVRMKIGKVFRLKNKGLTPREIDGMKKSIKLKQLNLFQREKLDKPFLNEVIGLR